MEWNYGQTCIKRPAWGQRKKGPYKTGDLLTKRGSIHMGFSIIGQEKGDLIWQVTTWAGLTVLLFSTCYKIQDPTYIHNFNYAIK